ncbi:O-methyltransferase-domain-containing protein [Massariosphaeria phaeospora]|uniref:O-methyltransferase-domain-containing protein n=1 Tax=Massariosphaeria phaeospora TaxID=100035 RepID=A0A7C8MB68_9PLEO|nr:O-methyltransferase-domain-containing protein [Massariosphaeria phaeospora]
MSEAIELIEQLSSLSRQPDFTENDGAHMSALHLAKKLEQALQKPEDAALELCFYPTFAASARVAINLKLFHLIAEAASPVTATELSKASGCSEPLLIRLLRPLSALQFMHEAGANTWTASAITKAMCIPAIEAAHIHFWDQGTTAALHMPSFFTQTQYRQPEDPRNGLFQHAFGTEKEAFEHWATQPHVLDNFNTCMTGIRGSRPSWIEWWPVHARILDVQLGTEDVLLVDVGGGRGDDVQAFGRKFADAKGRLVLEDRAVVIADIQQLDERVERVAHDFFTPQPITGARVYFLHFILHDWSDAQCLAILARTTAAMQRGHSKLLLNEFVLPNQGCPLFPTGLDLQMMAMHAAQERTEMQWRQLLDKAGLKVLEFYVPDGRGEGIIEAELK